MNAWLLHDFGMANLLLGTTETPAPRQNEVLVKVSAVALNFRDKAIVDGLYAPKMIPKPLIPVSDAVGVVIAVGPGVMHLKEGDRVNSHLFSTWLDGDAQPADALHCYGAPLPGGLAEYMVLNAASAVKVPEYMTDEEAATLPTAALTAWFALVEYGHLKAGETVLVQGTGGVSIFAIQIASALGAKVIVTSSREENLARAKALGAWNGINYATNTAWEQRALELTGGLGVDHVLDVAGGNGLNQSVLATRIGGHIAQIGFLQGQTTTLNLMPILFRQTTIRGIAVGHARAFAEMNAFLDEHQIHPVIERVYDFADSPSAYEHLARGAFGKVVVRVSGT